jgi:hypothetical protein
VQDSSGGAYETSSSNSSCDDGDSSSVESNDNIELETTLGSYDGRELLISDKKKVVGGESEMDISQMGYSELSMQKKLHTESQRLKKKR